MAKPKTPEQRARDAARKKALRAQAKQLGLSSKDIRSGLAAKVKAEQQRLEEAKRKTKTKTQAKSKTKSTRKKKPNNNRKVEHRKDFIDFETFVLNHPEYTSARKAKTAYRAAGGSIAQDMGDKLFRRVRETAKHYEKAHYKSYNRDNAPIHPPIVLDRYYYIIRYEEERETQPDTYIKHATITSDVRLKNAYEVVLKAYEYFETLLEKGLERYRLLRIIPDSVVVLYEIDWGLDARRRRRVV